MKLAVSNIAWSNDEEDAVADKLRSLGVKYVEIAPTKRWEDPTLATIEEARDYVEWWKSKGIEVIAFQSMLFARPDLKIFESQENREETLKYMTSFIELAGTMGAGRMVFGSPKNRQKGDLTKSEADEISRNFFAELGRVAEENSVVLCIEPNAPEYACDYITNAEEGFKLVHDIDNRGVGLHLDTACMYLAGDNLSEAITNSASLLKHYHVSAPMLGAVGVDDSEIDHASAASALRGVGYEGFISIEMRPGEPGQNVERIEKAVVFTRGVYGI